MKLRPMILCLSLISLVSWGEAPLQRRLTLDFKEIAMKNLFDILGHASELTFRVEPSLAEKKVTLKFQNMPLQMVLDGVAAQLGVRYRKEGEVLVVEAGQAVDELNLLRARVTELEKQLKECNRKE